MIYVVHRKAINLLLNMSFHPLGDHGSLQILSLVAISNVYSCEASYTSFNHPFTKARQVDDLLPAPVTFVFDSTCECQILQELFSHYVFKEFMPFVTDSGLKCVSILLKTSSSFT